MLSALAFRGWARRCSTSGGLDEESGSRDGYSKSVHSQIKLSRRLTPCTVPNFELRSSAAAVMIVESEASEPFALG